MNSSTWPWRPAPASPATSRLYRNRGDGTFEDVSVATNMDLVLYGMGVASGDYDGDGWVDVFVTAVGENRLLRNVGGERFADVTAATGVAGLPDAWSTSAAFLDIDADADLDLFVCNYVAWSPETDREVDYRLTGIGRAYGPPTDFPGTDSYLYRNDGGKFTDVSAEAGVRVANEATGLPVGKALAVRPVDANGDGLLDLSSPTTPCATSCSSIPAMAGFAKPASRPVWPSTRPVPQPARWVRMRPGSPTTTSSP